MAKDALELLPAEKEIHRIVQLLNTLLCEQLKYRRYQQDGHQIEFFLVALKKSETTGLYFYVSLGPPSDRIERRYED